MQSRRAVLSAGAVGAYGLLAGCVGCSPGQTAWRLGLDLHDIQAVDAGWELVVSAGLDIENASVDGDGVGPFEITLYDQETTVLGTELVDGLRWEDVPESQREETECASRGSTSVTRTVTVADVPTYIGPRFRDPADARTLLTGLSSEIESLTAVRYAGSKPGKGTDEAVAPTDFEQVDVGRLPWPEPDNQAIRSTEILQNVQFHAGPGCTRSRPGVEERFDDGTLFLEWARPVPDGSCQRPYLSDARVEDGRLVFEIGLHEPPHVLCRECSMRRYTIQATVDADPLPFETVELVHIDSEGTVIERVRSDSTDFE